MTLYGLKLSWAAFRALLADKLDKIVFNSSTADPYVWIRTETKEDGEQYYEFVLVYVDNIIAISQDTVSEIREVAEKFKLKKYKIEPPDIYLGWLLARK